MKTFTLLLAVSLTLASYPPPARAQEPGTITGRVTGPGAGHPPVVNVFVQGSGGDDIVSFLAYPKEFTGGVRVAVGDVNGDTFIDVITAPGPGIATHIKIFDGASLRRMNGRMGHFMAYPGDFQGGVFVAAGDVNGDGRADVITGPGEGAPPHVRVFDALTGKVLHSFLAYDPSFRGGVRVAAGDVDGDGVAEIITGAGPGGGPHIKIFDIANPTESSSFFAYPNFTGGVFVVAGDVNGDGLADIITGADAGGGPHVRVFDARDNLSLLHDFFAFDPGFLGGVRVATADVNGDGFADIIVGAGPGAGPHVRVFDARNNLTLLHDFFAYSPNFLGGVYVGGFSAPRLR